jgi:ribosomal protein S18 acetylase RimI-like enzyme
MNGVRFSRDEASLDDLTRHLRTCDPAFMPPLSERLDIGEYSAKLAANATRFEAWSDQELIGLIAAYCNAADKHAAFITSVSVLSEHQGKGIAADLLERCILHMRKNSYKHVELEVNNGNDAAIALYARCGFASTHITDNLMTMTIDL